MVPWVQCLPFPKCFANPVDLSAGKAFHSCVKFKIERSGAGANRCLPTWHAGLYTVEGQTLARTLHSARKMQPGSPEEAQQDLNLSTPHKCGGIASLLSYLGRHTFLGARFAARLAPCRLTWGWRFINFYRSSSILTGAMEFVHSFSSYCGRIQLNVPPGCGTLNKIERRIPLDMPTPLPHPTQKNKQALNCSFFPSVCFLLARNGSSQTVFSRVLALSSPANSDRWRFWRRSTQSAC